MNIIELLKVVFLGIVEGITEWLPISSTGHMLLVDEFLKLNVGTDTVAYKEMFIDVIQLGAIMAVVVVFWGMMWPFCRPQKNGGIMSMVRKDIFSMWFKVVVACVPGAIATFAFNDFIEEKLSSPYWIAGALIVYGIAFIVVESLNKKRTPRVSGLAEITYKYAFIIGLFQVLSIIPGTSRSGATIIGALLIGISRKAAAEFTFFLAVPVMFGLSAYKLYGYVSDFGISENEIIMLLCGMAVAFAVSLFVIKFLMSYIRKHDFKVFGWYRIVLGIAVILYFAIFG